MKLVACGIAIHRLRTTEGREGMLFAFEFEDKGEIVIALAMTPEDLTALTKEAEMNDPIVIESQETK